MGRSTRTTQHLVGTRTGVISARTVKRRLEALKWDREACEAMNFVLRLIDGLVARPDVGWTPTPGCKACDEGSTGIKCRGRLFNHTPECAERKAVFRERLRELKMWSADEAPPVMEPVAGPVLPWRGTSESACASSSSSGVVGPEVRRGPQRASDGADMEIADICSLISVNVNEEPVPQVPVMEFSDEEEEWQALCVELARLDEFDAKKDIPRDQVTETLLTFMRVRTVKNGAPNYRLCLRSYGRQSERSKRVSFLPDT